MDASLQLFGAWWQRFDYCFDQNPSAIICETFWTNAIGAFIGAGVLLVVFGIWKIFDFRRKARRSAIAEWERNSVDEAGIREAMWKGGDAVAASDAPDEALVAKIRSGVEQRKREMSESRNSPTEPTGA